MLAFFTSWRSIRRGQALVMFDAAALRNDGPLMPKDKELVAAYVSGLNACQYCFGVHSQTAHAFGVPEEVLTRLLNDVDTAPVEEKLKPLLRYARKLTQEPSCMTKADAQAVLMLVAIRPRCMTPFRPSAFSTL